MGRELERIDENTRDHGAAALAGDPHKRQVAIMEIAHRRHERHVALGAQRAA